MRKAASHQKALMEACARTSGPIIEVGAGRNSTPLLLALGRPLVTVEHVAEYAPVGQLGHAVTDSLLVGVGWFAHYGVALVDGTAEERATAVHWLRRKCVYIVVHDTEATEDYLGLEDALGQCRYRHDFKELIPWTTIVSDLRPWEP